MDMKTVPPVKLTNRQLSEIQAEANKIGAAGRCYCVRRPLAKSGIVFKFFRKPPNDMPHNSHDIYLGQTQIPESVIKKMQQFAGAL